MARRNAQDFRNAQTITWERMRDTDANEEERAEAAPMPRPSRQPNAVLRRSRDGRVVRINGRRAA